MIMNFPLRLSLVLALLPATLLAPQSASAQQEMREGKTYVGLMGTRLNYRSVDEELLGKGWSSMAALVLGTHVSEHFHAELRAGSGLAAGTIDDQLEVNIDYFVSWYFGGHYPISSYCNLYGQFGFTHLQGEAELVEGSQSQAYAEIARNEYPGSSFSTSWLAGLDFEVVDDGFVFLEAGKFFEDTDSNSNVFQYSLGLKYEF
jgi:outer membrane protein with beta-barrel domain